MSILYSFMFLFFSFIFLCFYFFFFFSSRRRHTRFSRDWSSDVCSSDLRDKGEDVREPQLQPHDSRQHQGHQPDPDRSDRVLDGDDFCVLAPDVLPDKGLRVVELWLFDFGRWNVSRFVMGNGGHRWFLIAESSL